MNHSVPLAIVFIESAGVPEILIELSICEFVHLSIEIGCEIEYHEESDQECDHNRLIPTREDFHCV